MPKPVQDAVAALALARAYNIKGKIGLSLDETVVPVHILGSLDELGDPYGATLFQTAAAGQFASVLLDVQADSGVIARVTDTWVTTGSGTGGLEFSMQVRSTSPNVGGAGFARRRDSRMPETGTTNVRILGDATVAGAGTAETLRLNPGPNRSFHVAREWWVTPGSQLWVTCRTAAERILVAFAWDQLPLTPSSALDK